MDSITVTDLVKRYGEHEAVKGITFAVPKGEVFGFLGPNGAGKTTTINVLCTLIKPTAGAATVNGYDVLTQRSEVRRSIGLVFQEATLDEYLTAEQNLLFHAYAYGVPRALPGRADARAFDARGALGQAQAENPYLLRGNAAAAGAGAGATAPSRRAVPRRADAGSRPPNTPPASGTTSSTSASGNG